MYTRMPMGYFCGSVFFLGSGEGWREIWAKRKPVGCAYGLCGAGGGVVLV
jgi:hypothetical protein